MGHGSCCPTAPRAGRSACPSPGCIGSCRRASRGSLTSFVSRAAPTLSVGELAVDPSPPRARPNRVVCCSAWPPHLAVDARVAEPGPLVIGVPGQERCTAEVQEQRRVRVADAGPSNPICARFRESPRHPSIGLRRRASRPRGTQRAQHLHGHPVEALCLRPYPEGDLCRVSPSVPRAPRPRQVTIRTRPARRRAARGRHLTWRGRRRSWHARGRAA